MKRIRICAAVVILLALWADPGTFAQQQGGKPPGRPPEVEKLLQLAKDPDRLRDALSDPRRVQELMDLMESDAVREFASDPQQVMGLMTEIDPLRIREVVQSIDPSIIRRAATARYMERLRKQMGATEEEWQVLAPRIEALLRAQQEARAGIRGMRLGGMGPSGGVPGGGRGFGNLLGRGAEGPSDVELAAEAVRFAAEDPDLSRHDTALALKEYRKARDKARERVAAAERDVRELVTRRQEAILMMLGLLE